MHIQAEPSTIGWWGKKGSEGRNVDGEWKLMWILWKMVQTEWTYQARLIKKKLNEVPKCRLVQRWAGSPVTYERLETKIEKVGWHNKQCVGGNMDITIIKNIGNKWRMAHVAHAQPLSEPNINFVFVQNFHIKRGFQAKQWPKKIPVQLQNLIL